MFCSVCGYQNLQGVNYCKQCGANLNPASPKSISPWIVAIFLSVIGFITLAGFTIPIIAVTDLIHSQLDFNKEKLMIIPLLFLLATFGIDFLLIRLLSRLLGLSKQGNQEPHPLLMGQPKFVTSEQPNQQLPAPPNSMPSVTEHTTRNFEPIISREQHNRETS